KDPPEARRRRRSRLPRSGRLSRGRRRAGAPARARVPRGREQDRAAEGPAAPLPPDGRLLERGPPPGGGRVPLGAPDGVLAAPLGRPEVPLPFRDRRPQGGARAGGLPPLADRRRQGGAPPPRRGEEAVGRPRLRGPLAERRRGIAPAVSL